MLPFLFSALAPTIFTGMAPLVASSLGAGIGTLAQGGDPEDALLAGLGGYLGGTLMGGMGGAAGGAGAEAATNAALMPGQTTVPGASPGVNMTQGTPLFQSMPNATGAELLPSPEALAASKPQGLFGSMKGALGDMTSPQNIGVGVGATMGPSLFGGMFGGADVAKDKKKWVSEARPPTSGTRPTPEGYVPGRSAEHDYGVSPNVARDNTLKRARGYAEGGEVESNNPLSSMAWLNQRYQQPTYQQPTYGGGMTPWGGGNPIRDMIFGDRGGYGGEQAPPAPPVDYQPSAGMTTRLPPRQMSSASVHAGRRPSRKSRRGRWIRTRRHCFHCRPDSYAGTRSNKRTHSG